MEKSYEREDLDQSSLKIVPATAPAALSDTPPSWPTNLRRRSSIEDDTNASNTTSSAPKEVSLTATVPPLAISSRESSIDTVLTHQSPTRTPEIPSAYANPTKVWEKKEAVKDLDEHTDSIIEERVSAIEETQADSVEASEHNKKDDLDCHTKTKLVHEEKSLSVEKEAEATQNQQTDLNYSDDFSCNISTPSETPSSDANIITVSPTKSLTIKKDQLIEEQSSQEENVKDGTVSNNVETNKVSGQHESIKESESDSVKSEASETRRDSPTKPELSGKTVDSICEKLMTELVKDTYVNLKESLNKSKSEEIKKEAATASRIDYDNGEKSNKPTSQQSVSRVEEDQEAKESSKSDVVKSKSDRSYAKERSDQKDGLAKSRPQDMMLTFDLSSESSSEGIIDIIFDTFLILF